MLQGGWTALIFAASGKDPEVVKVLLAAGSDANANDEVCGKRIQGAGVCMQGW